MMNEWAVAVCGGTIATVVGGAILAWLASLLSSSRTSSQGSTHEPASEIYISPTLQSAVRFLYWGWIIFCIGFYGVVASVSTWAVWAIVIPSSGTEGLEFLYALGVWLIFNIPFFLITAVLIFVGWAVKETILFSGRKDVIRATYNTLKEVVK